ncbi:MAG: DUF2752 domain-containing protein [Ruminococcaceae bacterium]|nr:DUF2752 domain-containing protein [Oscillospiraceae bacterium]
MKRLFSKISDVRGPLSLVLVLLIYCVFVYLFHLPCPIDYITGISCPGCGMTRALFSLLCLDFQMAWYYHPLIFFCIVFFPILLVAHLKNKQKLRRGLTVIFVVAFLATYLYRLFIVKSPILHFTPENGIFVRLLMYLLR